MSNVEIKKRIQEELEQGDAKLLQMIYALIKVYKKDPAMTPQTLDEYNKELDEALAEAENGHYITLEELEQEMKKW